MSARIYGADIEDKPRGFLHLQYDEDRDPELVLMSENGEELVKLGFFDGEGFCLFTLGALEREIVKASGLAVGEDNALKIH